MTCPECLKDFPFDKMRATRKHCSGKCSNLGMARANRARVKQHRKDRAQALYDLMGGAACQRCGYSKCRAALHFHHRDPSTKDFILSRRNLFKPWALLAAEAAKCDLLCANRHAEEHWLDSEKPLVGGDDQGLL